MEHKSAVGREISCYFLTLNNNQAGYWPSLVAQVVKNLPAVQSLGQKDPLEKGMATHPTLLA